MELPVWHFVGIGSGLIIGIVSVLHVFVAQFAVGGGIYLVWMERKAHRDGAPEILQWLERHTHFFLLLTMVFGGLSGVGIWFTIIITGDLSQKDLPKDAQSGLEVALRVLHNIDEISVIRFTSEDVVRHPLVQRIVNAYEEYENRHSRDKKQTQNKH